MSGRSHTHYKHNLHQHAQHGPHPYHVRHQTYTTYQPYPQLQQQDPDLRLRTGAEVDLGVSHHHNYRFCFRTSQTATMNSFTKCSKASKSSSQFSLPSTYDVFSTALSVSNSAYLAPKLFERFLKIIPTSAITRTLPQHMHYTLTLSTTQRTFNSTISITVPT